MQLELLAVLYQKASTCSGMTGVSGESGTSGVFEDLGTLLPDQMLFMRLKESAVDYNKSTVHY
jgi:hypothetical protein